MDHPRNKMLLNDKKERTTDPYNLDKFHRHYSEQKKPVLEGYILCNPICMIFFKINLFIFGCTSSSLLHAGFSLVAASWGYSSLWCVGLSLWLLLLQSTGSRRTGFSSCGMWAQLWLMGSRAQAQ